jgi:hypothetical protein
MVRSYSYTQNEKVSKHDYCENAQAGHAPGPIPKGGVETGADSLVINSVKCVLKKIY